jgi:hypothetical protein
VTEKFEKLYEAVLSKLKENVDENLLTEEDGDDGEPTNLHAAKHLKSKTKGKL